MPSLCSFISSYPCPNEGIWNTDDHARKRRLRQRLKLSWNHPLSRPLACQMAGFPLSVYPPKLGGMTILCHVTAEEPGLRAEDHRWSLMPSRIAPQGAADLR